MAARRVKKERKRKRSKHLSYRKEWAYESMRCKVISYLVFDIFIYDYDFGVKTVQT